jgi:hypothetical protein
MDVRNPGAGHIAWIDVSHPGEAPRYVSQWPLPPSVPAAPLPIPDQEADGPAPARPVSRQPNFF